MTPDYHSLAVSLAMRQQERDRLAMHSAVAMKRLVGVNKARAEWIPSKPQVMAALLIGSILFLGCVGLAWAGLHRYQQYEISEARV